MKSREFTRQRSKSYAAEAAVAQQIRQTEIVAKPLRRSGRCPVEAEVPVLVLIPVAAVHKLLEKRLILRIVRFHIRRALGVLKSSHVVADPAVGNRRVIIPAGSAFIQRRIIECIQSLPERPVIDIVAGSLLLVKFRLRFLLPFLLRVREPLVKEVIVCSIIRVTALGLISVLLRLTLLIRSLLVLLICSLLIRSLLVLLIRSLLICSLLILVLLMLILPIRSLLMLVLPIRSLLMLVLLIRSLLVLLIRSLLTIPAPAVGRTACIPVCARPALPRILNLPVSFLNFLETLLGILLIVRILVRVPLFTLVTVRLLQICITAVRRNAQHFEWI